MKLSQLLVWYRFHVEHPGRLRVWTWIRHFLAARRLTIPYGRFKISLDERDYPQREVLENGRYEPEVWEALSSRAQPGDVVWDVGAHVGIFSLLAGQDSRVKRIECFEASNRQADVLCLNIALNRESERIRVHRVALWHEEARLELREGPSGNLGMTHVVAAEQSVSAGVAGVPGALMVERGVCEPPQMIKLDVEGAELAVLKGIGEEILRGVRAIVFESLDCPPHDLPEFALLDEFGFRVSHIGRSGGERQVRENFLASRD